MPTAPGQYDFRYFTNDTFNLAAPSNVVTVGTSHRLTATPDEAEPYSTVVVNWTAPGGQHGEGLDWVL